MKKRHLLVALIPFTLTLVSCNNSNKTVNELYEVTDTLTETIKKDTAENIKKTSVVVSNTNEDYSGVCYDILEENGTYTYKIVTNINATCQTKVMFGEEVLTKYNSIDVYVSENNSYDATIIGYDEKTTLAVVSFTANELLLEEAKFQTNIEKSEAAFTCSLLDSLSTMNSVTTGVISSTQRLYFTTDCDTTFIKGYGAGVFNQNSELLGIIVQKNYSNSTETAYYNRMTIGVKSEYVLKAIELIEDTNGEVEHFLLGVTILNYQPNLSTETHELPDDFTHAVVVTNVEPLSRAAIAGIKEEDLIVGVDGISVNSNEDVSSVMYFVQSGDTITLTIMRKEDTGWTEFPVSVTF